MSKFTHINFVEEIIINLKVYKEYEGWRFYRIEYKNYRESDYSIQERAILLPANFDAGKLEKEINECINSGR